MNECLFCKGGCKPNCLLRAKAYCSWCCTTGHFTTDCHNHVAPRKQVEIVPSVKLKEPKTNVRLQKDLKSIRGFLYFNKLSITQDLQKNVRMVEKHCKEKGIDVEWMEIPQESEDLLELKNAIKVPLVEHA